MRRRIKHSAQGQSLIEVVVAIAVVILIVSGLIIAVISSLRSAQSSKARSVSTKLTQDGIESIRNLRDSGWATFISKSSATSWCLGTDGLLTDHPPCPQNIVTGGITFIRTVLIADTGGDQATVTVTVTWTEGQTAKNSTVTTVLTKWR
jgi:type II secretory pathway pseudopilin PulG